MGKQITPYSFFVLVDGDLLVGIDELLCNGCDEMRIGVLPFVVVLPNYV